MKKPTAAAKFPSTRVEHRLFREGHQTVAGIDEVGRGAWAGPLAVGVAVATRSTLRRLPAGVRDSKQLTELSRERLFEPLAAALSQYAIGLASPRECDELGMTKAQRLATCRALEQLEVVPDAIIIDGPYNFTDRADVQCLIKADSKTLIVAAASVLAKVTRDRMMIAHAPSYPGFGFDRNKGYGSRQHREEIARTGITGIHRASWSFATGQSESMTTLGSDANHGSAIETVRL